MAFPATAFYWAGKGAYEYVHFIGVNIDKSTLWVEVVDTSSGSRKCSFDCYTATVRLPIGSDDFEVRVSKSIEDYLNTQITLGNRTEITDPIMPRRCAIKLTIETGRSGVQRANVPSYFDEGFKVDRDIRCFD